MKCISNRSDPKIFGFHTCLFRDTKSITFSSLIIDIGSVQIGVVVTGVLHDT